MERLGEVPVAVVEKGKVCGAHNLSGAMMRPSGLQELFPDLEPKDWPTYGQVDKDSVYWMLSPNRALPLKPTPPPFRNHGNYVVSVAELSRWLAEKAEEAGAYILTETAAAQLLVEDGAVRGIRSGDKGRGKDGNPLGNFEPGADVTAQATVLAEGTWGHLTGAAIREFDLAAEPRAPGVGARGQGGLEGPAQARPRDPHAGLAAALRRQAQGVRRLVDLPDGRRPRVDRLRRRPGLHRRHRLGPRPAAAVQDLQARAQDPRGRRARRLGRQGDPRGRLLGDAQAVGAGHGHRRRRGRDGQRPGPQGHPLRDPRRDPGRRGDLREAQGGLERLQRLRAGRRGLADRQGALPVAQHEAALRQGLLRGRRDHQRDGHLQGPLPGRALEQPPRRRVAGAHRRQEGRLSQARRQVHLRQALERLHHGQRDPRRRAQPHPRARERAARGGRGVGVDVPGRGLRGPRGRARTRATST